MTDKLDKLIEDIVRQKLSEEINPINKVVNTYKETIEYITLRKKIFQMYSGFVKYANDQKLDRRQWNEAFIKVLIDSLKR